MNKRIKELIEQSYKEAVETNDHNGSAYMVREFDEERFAELIVRECAELIETQHTWITSVAASMLIRKHFGVEE